MFFFKYITYIFISIYLIAFWRAYPKKLGWKSTSFDFRGYTLIFCSQIKWINKQNKNKKNRKTKKLIYRYLQ